MPVKRPPAPKSRDHEVVPLPGMPTDSPEKVKERAREALEEDLRSWWLDSAEQEVARTVPKAVEYSSQDLHDLGTAMADMLNVHADEMPDPAELACWFYLLGKVARAIGAIKESRSPSDDTVFDIVIYAKMIQRIRDAGGWPG